MPRLMLFSTDADDTGALTIVLQTFVTANLTYKAIINTCLVYKQLTPEMQSIGNGQKHT